MSGSVPRIGVIGLGHWGKNLVRIFHNLGALDALTDSDPAILCRFADQYPAARITNDAAAMFADPALDAIVIATPAATHGTLAASALDAGKQVFVEKPLCLDLSQAAQLKDKAESRGLVLMVGHLLLYHPAFLALRERVEAGELGTLRYIYSNRLSLGKIRREENALWSFAPHDISMILQLMGGLPACVTANGGNFLSDGIADTTMSHMTFAGGAQAHIFVSWLHPYKDQRLVVIGERAMAVFNDVATGREKLLLYRHEASWDDEIPVVNKAEAEPIPFVDAEPLRVECQAFLSAVAGHSNPPSDAEEGINVLRVLDACQRSITSGTSAMLDTANTASGVAHG